MAFRQRGFAGVSVRELERVTGVSAGSLYNAYGDKDGVYRAAMAHYVATIIHPRLIDATTIDDLEGLFLGLFDFPMSDGHGCLVTNAVIEFGGEPCVAADLVAEGLDAFGATIIAVLTREIGAAEAATATLHLTMVYQGILVLSRAGRATAALIPVIRAEFDRLRALRLTSP